MSALPRTAAAAAAAADLVRSGRAADAMPSVRFELSETQWLELAERLVTDPITVAGLWGDGDQVHALLLDSPDAPLIASVPVDNKRVLALSPARPTLAVCERILRDLWGIEAMRALDLRPWLDHGAWSQTAPLSARPGPAAWPPEPPEFEWSDADAAAGAMQLPIGPVQGLLRGPAHLRVTVVGERVRRLEPLLGFNHRGVALRLRGTAIAEAAALVGRIDAAACVAHQHAFAQAVEAANGWVADGGTRSVRDGMAALERLGAHLRRLQLPQWRDRLLDSCAAAFGHRLMRGAIVPGGWGVQPDPFELGALPEKLSRLEMALAGLPAPAMLLIRRDIAVARKGLAVPLPATGLVRVPIAGIREGLGMVDTVHGRLWHWVRLEAGRVLGWHAVDPTLSCLAELAEQAPGSTLEQLQERLRAADLSAAGADQ